MKLLTVLLTFFTWVTLPSCQGKFNVKVGTLQPTDQGHNNMCTMCVCSDQNTGISQYIPTIISACVNNSIGTPRLNMEWQVIIYIIHLKFIVSK